MLNADACLTSDNTPKDGNGKHLCLLGILWI